MLELSKVFKKYEGVVDKQDSQGNTELMSAALDNDALTVIRLLEAGANPNIQDNYGYTALMLASRQGNVESVTLLINKGADLEIQRECGLNAFDCMLISSAINDEQKMKISEIFIDKGYDPTKPDKNGKYMLNRIYRGVEELTSEEENHFHGLYNKLINKYVLKQQENLQKMSFE